MKHVAMTTFSGYTDCRGCGVLVIGEHLCCYCEEARIENGMNDFDDLTPRELDTLNHIAYAYPEED
jgi:hypothetical protein